MRLSKFAVAASAAFLAACGGEKTPPAETPAAAAPAAAAAAPSPITGKTEDVKMVGDDKGSRYEPPAISIHTGDGIKFTSVTLGPHNVSFDPAALSAEAKTALNANISEPMSELSGKLVGNGESYTLSFGGVPAGTYEAICVPHASTGMKMKITVQ